MNAEIFANVLLQVPSLAVVVYLVVHFLSFLRQVREEERDFMADLIKNQIDVIERNTEALVENRELAKDTRAMLADVHSRLESITIQGEE